MMFMGIQQPSAVPGDGISSAAGPVATRLPRDFNRRVNISIALPSGSPGGEASIREHCIVWSAVKSAWYLIGDVLLLDNPSYPDTWRSDIGLWKSADLVTWTYLGICIAKNLASDWGVASPSGAVEHGGRILVPFCRRGSEDAQLLTIDMAQSGADPDAVPWTRLGTISAPPGLGDGFDDPALVLDPKTGGVHLYHRATVVNPNDGVRRHTVLHSYSATPTALSSWPTAEFFLPRRPDAVTTQEMTAVFWWRGSWHLVVMEQESGLTRSACHWVSPHPTVGWQVADPVKPRMTADYFGGVTEYLNGHYSVAMRGGEILACTWSVLQTGAYPAGRYGIGGRLVHQRNPAQATILPAGTVTVPTNTWTRHNLRTTPTGAFDETGLWVDATQRFVADVAARVQVSARLQLEGNVVAGTLMQMRVALWRNGGAFEEQKLDQRTSPTAIYDVFMLNGISTYIDLAPADYFEIQVWHNAAGNMIARADLTGATVNIQRL